MADRPKVLNESGLVDTGAGSIGFYRVPQFSTSDTCTLSDFASITAVAGYRGDTLAALTFTISTNVVTLTSAAMTNVKCYIIVVGIR